MIAPERYFPRDILNAATQGGQNLRHWTVRRLDGGCLLIVPTWRKCSDTIGGIQTARQDQRHGSPIQSRTDISNGE